MAKVSDGSVLGRDPKLEIFVPLIIFYIAEVVIVSSLRTIK